MTWVVDGIRKVVILRSPRSGRLEGRNAFCPAPTTRTTVGREQISEAAHAAVATCAVRHPARGCLLERRVVEPAAAKDAGGGAGSGRAQGAAMDDRPTISGAAIRAGAARGGPA